MKHLTRGRTRLLAWTAAGLAGTGLIAGVASAATSGGGASPSGFAALTADSAPLDPSAAGTGAQGSKGNRAKALLQIERKLAAGSVRGEVVLNTKKGMQTVDFQRGNVSDASATGFTLTDASGTAQSWAISSTTKVRDRKAAGTGNASSATLTNGENVVVIGLKADGTLTARLVMVVPARAGAGAGTAGTAPQATGTPSASST
jgi:hypothetical protein